MNRSEPTCFRIEFFWLAALCLAITGCSSGSNSGGPVPLSLSLSSSMALAPRKRIIFPGASPSGPVEKLKCASLFIVARDDANADGPWLPGIRAKYEKAPDQAERGILRFLSAKRGPDGPVSRSLA